MEYSKRVETIFNDQLTKVYNEFNIKINNSSDGLSNFITVEDFVFEGIKLSCLGSRMDYCFERFDSLDYLNVEAFLKPRLCYDAAKFYFNKRKVNCYLYKDFALTEKGAFENAMYRFRSIEQFKDVLFDLKELLEK
jgi:hypothetical protein